MIKALPYLLGSFCFLTAAPAAVTFNLDYVDVSSGNGIGFDDPSLGALRRNTLEDIANNYLGAILDHTATVDITVQASQTDGTGALASGGTFYFQTANSFQSGLLFQHITTGVDPSTQVSDGNLTFDFGYAWAYDNQPTSSESDFRSTALHEITHALGFASLITQTGDSEFGNNIYGTYDQFLVDGNGDALIAPGGGYQAAVGALTSEVRFTGANARAANGGNDVIIFTPDPYNDGSSISHVDEATYPNAVMSPSLLTGTTNREYTALDQAILEDLGYSFVAVPEPSSALSLLAAMGLGIFARRR